MWNSIISVPDHCLFVYFGFDVLVYVCVRTSRFYYVLCNVSTIHARVLKFHIWISYGK